MIYFDVTKTAAARHRSGLMRVSQRLQEELGERAVSVVWSDGAWRASSGRAEVAFGPCDWLLTPELFSEAERPGFWTFLRSRSVRTAAIFHDAIPLKLPHITWPQSVARHPEYMKMLAHFDRVFAVSRASADELTGFWRWQGVEVRAAAEPIALGADFARTERVRTAGKTRDPAEPPLLLCVGIIEPRKNQTLLLEVAERLARENTSFRLAIVGRVNPHFGAPIEKEIRRTARRYSNVEYLAALDDEAVRTLWSRAQATLFPTLAEGCGLPLLESLWMGVPCLCSDLRVLRENGEGGGCEFVPVNDAGAWHAAVRRVVTDPIHAESLREAAQTRVLPTWRQTADRLVAALGD